MTDRAFRQAVRWLLLAFEGSTVVSFETSTPPRPRRNLPERYALTDKQQPLFDSPGEPPPSDQLSDYAGALMFIMPLEVKSVTTEFGAAEPILADIVVLAPKGLVSLPGALIFWKGVITQLAGKVGTGRWVGARLVQGAGRNAKAWSLVHPTHADHELLMAAAGSDEFKALVATADEPF